jgi:hypothetical protein
VTLVELVSQNLLCDADKGGLVGSDLQEFRVGHRAVIGSKGLLLPSHKLLRSPPKKSGGRVTAKPDPILLKSTDADSSANRSSSVARIRRIEAQDSTARREPLQEDLPAVGKTHSISVSKRLGGLFDKGHFCENADLQLFPPPLRDFPVGGTELLRGRTRPFELQRNTQAFRPGSGEPIPIVPLGNR